jgi:hypothetical protein
MDTVKLMMRDNAEHFKTPEDIKEYIEFCLEAVPSQQESKVMTFAFHWREWNNGEKKIVSVDCS